MRFRWFLFVFYNLQMGGLQLATMMKTLADGVGFLQRAFLGPDSKKPTGNGFTVANPNPNSNNGGHTTAMSQNNVGTASVQQKNQNTGGKTFELVPYDGSQQNSDMMNSDNYNGGGMSALTQNNTGGTQGGGSTGGAGQQQAMTFSNDYMERAGELMTQLEKMLNTPFSYNYQTDPAYLAAVEAAKQNAKKASSNTMQTMSDRGIFNSSVTSNQLAQIEQEAQSAPMQLIPGLEANAYNRNQNQLSNTASLMNTLLSAGQNQQTFDATQAWRKTEESYKEADYTGTLETPQMRQLLDAVVAAKQGYMNAATPGERAQFAEAANSARAAMKALGMSNVDQLFGGGATVDQALANFGNGGIQTVQSKQNAEEKAWREDRAKVEDTHWDKDYKLRLADSNKPRGGGGGGGLTFDQLLKGNTNRMLTSMLSEIDTPDQIAGWIKSNTQDILEAGVNPSTLEQSARSFLGGGGDVPKTETPGEIYDKAVEAAMDDPLWEKAKTDEEQQAIISKWQKRFSQYNGPQAAPTDPVDTLFNFFKPWIPSNMGGNKQSKNKPSTSSSGGSSKMQANAR